MAATVASTGGVGFFGLLTIVFIALKLMVLSPLWLPFIIGLVVAIIILIVAEK